MTIFISFIIFTLGLVLGFNLRSVMLAKMNWSILKWDSDIFGYRLAPRGYKISRGDNIFMAIKIPTSNLPNDLDSKKQ
tara:strand:- start:1090 stop:1323 length:234 start_codon:yes stop_codon:yes gene_type:complete